MIALRPIFLFILVFMLQGLLICLMKLGFLLTFKKSEGGWGNVSTMALS